MFFHNFWTLFHPGEEQATNKNDGISLFSSNSTYSRERIWSLFSGAAGFFAQSAVFQFFQFLYTVQAML
jgi:hypothetical protein